MLTNQRVHSSFLPLLVGLLGVGVGIVAGFFAGAKPLYLCLALVAVPVLIFFFTKFEQTVMGLLILRSSLDSWFALQIPAAFAIGLDGLTLLYVIVMLLLGRPVHTDRFWWLFASWIMLQALWLILLPLGELGMDASLLPISIREWIRLFSFLMIYLLIMQLKDKLHPEKIVSLLFFSLVFPLTVALLQIFLPSVLPQVLGGGSITRIKGTFVHANNFTVYLFLFIGLTWWKLGYARRRWSWVLLLGLLVFVLSTTKTMVGLAMLCIFVIVMIAPKLSLTNLIAGVLLFAALIGLFVSTELGQERLSTITQTPLLNPDIDISRAILLSQGDYNSFNWRIAYWNYLIQAWQHFPIFGYGLGLSSHIHPDQHLPHNDYVRALVEGGIFGFTALLIFFGAQFARLVQLLWRTPPNSIQHQLCWNLLAVFIALLVGMLSENVAVSTAFYFYYWTVFAVCGWNWNEKQTWDKSMPVTHV
ncbi:O-antigen ligase family protein [Fischerella thermalis]|jgi:O-antigen ligase|uniref:O-antigen ligase family protein n=1 Tax=Fischerella thermalis TaxID=372787 RepID=UPI0002DDF960|nr:O-antigen ligase family protein [Fischerella thermalis]PMB43325.1 polymerase [Fischerella thermalis CCMEE 5205]PLZ11954.1 polymerase [Fischerella thermalis WC1110]PLZ14554.1 polymerase [Fischerella thermalis WC119]PLZ15014.1 polymerase [Fischerella thermalis WC114]PLZ19790.1 polymerase [Fischerella thermalis WC341]